VACPALDLAHAVEHDACRDAAEQPVGEAKFAFSRRVREVVRHAVLARVRREREDRAVRPLNQGEALAARIMLERELHVIQSDLEAFGSPPVFLLRRRQMGATPLR
jgi:hypothetical protein